MGKNPEQLNQKQVDVLRWIGGGCPAGKYADGYEHRIIARALLRRGLVKISGQGSTWTASITKAGRQWLAAPPAGVLPDDSEADRLIARVLDAGGRLVLPKNEDGVEGYERLVRMSMKSPRRPKGKKLELTSTGGWANPKRVIVLAEHFDDLVDARPVPVPGRIGKHHPAVKAYVSDKERQYVTKDHVPRAARILQAIASEAARRGLDALLPAVAAKGLPEYQAREVARRHLAVQTPAGVYSIQIKEMAGKGEAKAPRRWNECKTNPEWIENRAWEFISTGRLELIVRGPGSAYDGDRYRDAKTVTVEDRLPEVFRSFEIYKLRADWNEQEREREKAERRRRWEVAMASAKEQYLTHARWEHFKERSRDWQAINQHRAFLVAARAKLDQYVGDDRDAIERQLDEAQRTIDALDPVRHLGKIALALRDPESKDLEPFLHGWSTYGPDVSYR